MDIIVATNNPKKLKEMKRILESLDIHPISLAEAGIDIDIEEDGATFEENAMLKAKGVYELAKKPVVADDSGIMVAALGGAPGIFSARYAGEGRDDEENNDKLLREMVDKTDRRATFVCSIACVLSDDDSFIVTGKTDGEVAHERQGPPGFGYDPLFLIDGVSYSQMSAEGKDRVGHRGKALRAFAEKLREYLK